LLKFVTKSALTQTSKKIKTDTEKLNSDVKQFTTYGPKQK